MRTNGIGTLLALSLIAGPAVAGESSSSMADVLPLAQKIFEGKTLLGSDGTRLVYGDLESSGSISWMDFVVIGSFGERTQLIDSYLTSDGRALFVQGSLETGVSQSFYIRVEDAHLITVPAAPIAANRSGVLARDCWLEHELSVCHQRAKAADGSLQDLNYSESGSH